MSKQYYNRTLSISAKPRSKRLREAGVTVSGAASSQQSTSVGRGDIPLEDINKGVAAYGWGNHAQEGYLKSIDHNMVVSALGYTPSDGVKGLQRPQIKIVRGKAAGGDVDLEPSLIAKHPLLGPGGPADACFVLMVYRKRRGKWYTKPNIQYRDKWGEARGPLATSAPLTFNGVVPLDTLRLHIMHNYICIRGRVPPTTLNLDRFAIGLEARFGRLSSYSGTIESFKEKTSGSRLFGIALRYTNPAFTPLVDSERSLAETTRDINGVPRYIYTDIVPIRVTVGQDSNHHNTIGFQLGVGMS